MMSVNKPKRKMPAGLVKSLEFNKENLKSCGLQLICHVTQEFEKEQISLRAHVNECIYYTDPNSSVKILHSIFFLGFIHQDSLTPEDILPAHIAEAVRREFPEPFQKYKSHLPKRTPFSVLLEIMQLLHGTQDRVMDELCRLMRKLKFPYPLGRPASKTQNYYTLESTVICVCSNTQRSSQQHFGASLGCRTEKAKSLMIYSSCINTWHEYVSYAVMSFIHEEGDRLQFHESMQCQAYLRDWKDNSYKERQPCLNCSRLFGLPGGTEQGHYPYGNCAETESLSKLLFNDRFMRENVTIRNYTPDQMNTFKDSIRERLLNLLSSMTSLSIMSNNELVCFNPLS